MGSQARDEEVRAMNRTKMLTMGIAAWVAANGKPVPDGAMMAKVHWKPKQNAFFPDTTGPGELLNVDFMVKDSRRFADSGGWGYAVFDYDAESDGFKPGTKASVPPQGNDAKCG